MRFDYGLRYAVGEDVNAVEAENIRVSLFNYVQIIESRFLPTLMPESTHRSNTMTVSMVYSAMRMPPQGHWSEEEPWLTLSMVTAADWILDKKGKKRFAPFATPVFAALCLMTFRSRASVGRRPNRDAIDMDLVRKILEGFPTDEPRPQKRKDRICELVTEIFNAMRVMMFLFPFMDD